MPAGRTLASPIAERLPEHEVNEEEEQTDKEDIEDEDLKAPVELIIEVKQLIIHDSMLHALFSLLCSCCFFCVFQMSKILTVLGFSFTISQIKYT